MSTTLASVLQLVAALIIAAQQPNVPVELRVQAMQVAQNAVVIVSTMQTAPVAPASAVSAVPTPVFVGETRLEAIERERAALIAEREALYRKAEAMGGSRDTIAGYKHYLTKDVTARLEALNDEERVLRSGL